MTNTLRAIARGVWYGLLLACSIALPAFCLLLMLVVLLYVSGALMVWLLVTLSILCVASIVGVSWVLFSKESILGK